MPEAVRINQIDFYMRNVFTRMPFKYGMATLTAVPILHVLMQVEWNDGRRATGVAADILPPKWFDKDPAKEYQDNVDDLIAVARAAATAYQDAGRQARSVFALWREGYDATLKFGDVRGLNHLTAAHGSTLMERALIDAVGIGCGASYHQMLRANILGLDLGALHDELAGVEPGQVVAATPIQRMYIRHTVGLADPIWTSEITATERLDDGLPQALEQYCSRQGLRYLKIKVNGVLSNDLERLRSIAALLDRGSAEYSISLDGNEQYKDMDSFVELLQKIQEDAALRRFYENVLYIEQPLERSIALDPTLAAGIRAVAASKPLLVDESDGDLDSFKEAVALGYLGVSSKNCKGLIKAVANQGLAQHYTRQGPGTYFLSGEDLMNLPVVPLHQDLAHLAALGIEHVERNGHHYVKGLDHLSDAERQMCRAEHDALYSVQGESLALSINDGQINIASLQRPGLGVGVPTDVAAMVLLDDWNFETLR
jgi:hypothetical protein